MRRPGLLAYIPPEKVHGLVFDASVFVGNLALLGALPDPELGSAERAIGFLLLAAVGTQIAGAVLKGRPLSQRLASARGGLGAGCAGSLLKGLLFVHFLLFSVIALMAFSLTGAYDISGEGTGGGDIWVALALAVAALTTGAVWWASRRHTGQAQTRAGWPGQELVADLLLWVSATLTTRYFWQTLVEMLEPSRGVGWSARGLVLVGGMSVLFVVFYLPTRLLFLLEDLRSPLTWVQVWVAMLPVVWLVFGG
jgi:hypothetical protein